MYAIAERLSIEARRAAVARTYWPTSTAADSDAGMFPECSEGRCPLGVCLYVMGLGDWHSPTASDVADKLADHRYKLFEDIESEADDFIIDWDAGLVTDLAAALGVEQP